MDQSLWAFGELLATNGVQTYGLGLAIVLGIVAVILLLVWLL